MIKEGLRIAFFLAIQIVIIGEVWVLQVLIHEMTGADMIKSVKEYVERLKDGISKKHLQDIQRRE